MYFFPFQLKYIESYGWAHFRKGFFLNWAASRDKGGDFFNDFCHIHENGGGGPIGCVKREVKTPWVDMETGRLKGCVEQPIQHLMFYLLMSVLRHSCGAVLETPSPAAVASALLAGSSGCSHLPHGVGNRVLYLPLPFPSPPSILHFLTLCLSLKLWSIPD